MKIIITEEQLQKIVENTSIIDHILDKISDLGYESLNDDEKMVLKNYSEWLNSGKKGDFIEKITPKNDDFVEKTGEEFTTFLPDGSQFIFKYEYSDNLPNEDIHYGVVNWMGEEWSGLIANNKGGDLVEIDFVLDNGFQSYNTDDEFGIYDESKEKRLQDELGSDIKQIEYFFNTDVIPNLLN